MFPRSQAGLLEEWRLEPGQRVLDTEKGIRWALGVKVLPFLRHTWA